MKIPKLAFTAKALAVVAVIAGVATAGFDVKESKATLTAPTGKCGFSATMNLSGFNERYSNSSSKRTVSTVGVIDFDAGVADYIDTIVSDYGKSTATTSSISGQDKISIIQGAIPGQYVITINNSYNNKLTLMSSNSGNTYLFQSLAPESNGGSQMNGVCQAL